MLHANNIVRNIVHTVPLARPTIVLIGGVSGSGKSTLARQLAREHGADVLSSDTIRAALQAVLPYAAAPALHHSSFDVWRTLTTTPGPRDILAGFCKQAELLAPALRGAMERAVLERRSLVVEGVHAIPGLLPMTGSTTGQRGAAGRRVKALADVPRAGLSSNRTQAVRRWRKGCTHQHSTVPSGR